MYEGYGKGTAILPRGAYLSGWSSMASERLPFRHKQYILKRHGFRVSVLDCFSHLKAHFFGPNDATDITNIQDKLENEFEFELVLIDCILTFDHFVLRHSSTYAHTFFNYSSSTHISILKDLLFWTEAFAQL